MERVAPPQVNYDNVLPLAIESRSNRREFLPVNGQRFSNDGGSTIVRIDVNADSMLDATHSYLECNIRNDAAAPAAGTNFLALNGLGPSWIQRLRIESGGVVIEDINEYSRLYAMLVLNQCPKEYVKNNLALMGMYQEHKSSSLNIAAGGFTFDLVSNGATTAAAGASSTPAVSDLHYNMSSRGILGGVLSTTNNGIGEVVVPTDEGLTGVHRSTRLGAAQSLNMCIPLVSGFLNMDKYVPLVMMNAGFTIELTLCDANRIGITQTEGSAAGNNNSTFVASNWSVSGVKYVAHLIDLDRSFYDSLRMVMESSGGVLQLAGQSYRHFSGSLPAGAGEATITLPARVKSIKSIFGTFINSVQVGGTGTYDTPVFQTGGISGFRFEIGSVRYPQTDVDCGTYLNASHRNPLSGSQREAELEKAFGKIGDYQHQKAYSAINTCNVSVARSGTNFRNSTLSAFTIGYDFEAFQRVALEAGINTADRSLPINCIITRAQSATLMRADFYVLVDAIFFINLDGTASVSY
tara:strand:- start:2461 stop:4026 length:1566 start_codon:yes stop_codon:yes gene_type:complete